MIRDWVKGHRVELGSVDISVKVYMINTLLRGWISDKDIDTVDIICESIDTTQEGSIAREALNARVDSMIDLGQRTRIRFIISEMR